jgi:hypothetical protein
MIISDVGPWGVVPRAMIADMAGNSAAIAVYCLLSSYADRQTDDGWTAARKDLAQEVGVSPATFDRAVKALSDAGWVEVKHRTDDRGDQAWNRYIVLSMRRGVLTSDETPPHERPDPSSPVMNVPRPLSQTPLSDPSRASDAENLANRMADAIEQWGAKRPNVGKEWVRDMDRLLRIDERSIEDVNKVIHWLYTSSDEVAVFWAPNIQSPAKLRMRWDTMAGQQRRKLNGLRVSSGTQALIDIVNERQES